jgi:hypothetical protein
MAQVGPDQVGVSQVAPDQAGLAQVAPGQVGTAQVGTAQVSALAALSFAVQPEFVGFQDLRQFFRRHRCTSFLTISQPGANRAPVRSAPLNPARLKSAVEQHGFVWVSEKGTTVW